MCAVGRALPRLMVAVALAATTGCMPAVRQAFDARATPLTPFGARASDAALRRLLATGAAEAAVDALGTGRARRPAVADRSLRPTGDRLLDDLLVGATAFYAGRYATSQAALAAADEAAEQRRTRSLTREATALLTNDAARPYLPSRTERTLIPYYALLGFLERRDLEGATVEARRLAQRLEETEDQASDAERSLRASLRLLTASVFDAAGEPNDAAVARRHVARLTGDTAWGTARAPLTADSIDLLVIVEQGFVPHRLTQVAWLGQGDALDERWTTRATAAIAGDPDGGVFGLGRWGDRSWWWGDRGWAGPGEGTVVAWPVLAPLGTEGAPPIPRIGGPTRAAVTGSLAAAIVAEHRAALPALLLRAAARAGARQAAIAAARRSPRHRGVLTAVATLGALAFEQADLRSWSVLPARIGVLPLRLPATASDVTIEVGGRTHRLAGTRVTSALRLAHLRLFDDDPSRPLPFIPLTALLGR
jgi:hypothetical protein